MTAWLLSFGWNWLLVPVAIWWLNGLRKVWLLPRIRVLEVSKFSGGGQLVRIERQELVPPWRLLKETWVRSDGSRSAWVNGSVSDHRRMPLFTRQDGWCPGDSFATELQLRIDGAVWAYLLDAKHTEELSK